jgi:hypothetical protein
MHIYPRFQCEVLEISVIKRFYKNKSLYNSQKLTSHDFSLYVNVKYTIYNIPQAVNIWFWECVLGSLWALIFWSFWIYSWSSPIYSFV